MKTEEEVVVVWNTGEDFRLHLDLRGRNHWKQLM